MSYLAKKAKRTIKFTTLFFGLFLSTLGMVSLVGSAPVLTVTKTDALLVDVDTDGVADPGDTIRYTVEIQNTGDMNANNVVFDDTIDPNTTLSGVAHVSPLAFKDSYTSLGNVGINVLAADGLLLNDADPDGTVANAVSAVNGLPGNVGSATATTAGGSVTVQSNGSFVYTPTPGFEGDDTFTYTLTDGDPITPDDTDTVTITVNEVIWFIDKSSGAGGTGLLSDPFGDVSEFAATAADDPGDIIFIYDHQASGAYNGQLTLMNNQFVVGEGSTASIVAITGITVPPHSNVLPSTGGGKALLSNSAGNNIVLAQNNTIRGVSLDDSAGGFGFTDNGGTVGNLSISESNVGGTGGAVNIANGGALNVTLEYANSTFSPGYGINLNNVSGSFTVAGNTAHVIPTSGGIRVNGSSATVSFNGAIKTINTGAQPAVTLTSNTGTTTFANGGLNIDTTSGTGLFGTSVGTLNISGSNNTIDATNGTGVNIDGGILNVSLLSVSANNAAYGIRLKDIASGSFTVNGTGTTDGTGGTIQNITTRGVEIDNTDNVTLKNINLTNANTTDGVSATPGSTCDRLDGGTNTGCNAAIYIVDSATIALDNLNINDTEQNGVNGNNVTGLTLTNSVFTNIGNVTGAQRENALHIINLLGTSSINGNTFTGNSIHTTRNVLIENSTGTLNLTMNDNNIATANTNGVRMRAQGSATMNVSGLRNTFTTNGDTEFEFNAVGNSTIDVDLGDGSAANENVFIGTPATVGSGGGIVIDGRDSARFTFNILANEIRPVRSTVIAVVALGGSSGEGNITGNELQGNAQGWGIRAAAESTNLSPSLIVNIDGNTIGNVDPIGTAGSGAAGIEVSSQQGSAGAGTANVQGTINNNTVTIGGADSIIQHVANAGNTLCLSVTNNTAGGAATSPFAGGGSTHYIGNPVVGSGLAAGSITYNNHTAGNLAASWNSNGNSPALAGGSGGEAFVDGTDPTPGGACTAPSVSAPSPMMLVSLPEMSGSEVAQLQALAAGEEAAETLLAAQPAQIELIAASSNSELSVAEAEIMVSPTASGHNMARPQGLASFAQSGENINQSIGTMEPGQSVTIVWDVVIDDPLSPATTSQVCNQGNVTAVGGIDVDSDDPDTGAAGDTTCTPLDGGTVVIIKDSIPDAAQDFSFTSTGGLPTASFTLDDDADGSLSNTETINNVTPGSYTVTELSVLGFAVTNITCDDGASGAASTVDVTSSTATINVESGETVTCTFTNRQTTLVINEVDYDQPTPPTSDSAEFIELKNTGMDPVDLNPYTVYLINGSNNGNYASIGLPAVTLAPGDYYVICGNSATVPNCDLDINPNTNLIQNDTEAVVLLYGALNGLVDTVSYEGNVISPYTEGTGAGTDPGTAGNEDKGLSRITGGVDGADTNNNSVDFSVRCITPGESNTTDNADCRPQGTITIIKDTVPNDGEDFTFTTTGGLPLATFDLDDDGTPALANNISFNGVDAGSYTVTEAATPGYVTTLVCVDPDGGTTISGATATIDLDDGETVTCTYTNTLNSGTITIIKDTVPNDGQDFTFNTTGGLPLATFDLDDDGTATLANNISFNTVDAGSYTVTEVATAGYDTALVCVDPDGGTTISDATANIDLDAGETVVCTYTNTRAVGTVTIIKDTVPNDGQDFTFNTTGGLPLATFDLDDDGTATLANNISFNSVEAGSYTVTEVATLGYDTTLVCVDPDGGTATSSATANIDLDTGETVTCTFTNRREVVDLELSKSDSGITAEPGDTVVYTIIYENKLGFDTATNVILTETVPPNTTFNATASTGVWSCADGSPAGTICTQAVGNLLSNSTSSSTTFAVDVDNPFSATGGVQILNTATISSDQSDADPDNNTVFEATPITAAPELAITKSDGGGTFAGGDTIVYSIDVSNTGNRIAPSVIISETVPAHTSFNQGASSAGWTCSPMGGPAGANCTLQIPLLDNTPQTILFAVNLVNPLPIGVTSIDNHVDIRSSSQFPEANTDNNEFQLTTQLDNTSSITIIKDVTYVADIDVDSGRDFPFFSTELGNFFLDDPLIDDTDGITEEIVFLDQVPGNYTITEGPNGNWIQSVVCVGDDNISYLAPDIGATIDLDAGEDVVCTFTNERVTYDLTYTKVLSTGSPVPPTDWEFTLASLLNLVPGDIDIDFGVVTTATAAGGSSDTLTLPLDAYKVGEVVPGNYELVQIDCGPGGLSTAPPVNDQFTIILDQNLTCTFTNQTTKAEIMLTKNVIKDHGGTAGVNDFGLSINGTLVNSGQTILVTANQPVTIDEVGLDGYDFVSITGDAKCPAVLGGSMTPAPGEKISCTITNDDQPGTLTIIKDTVPDDPQDFSFSVTGGLIPANFLLDDDANATLNNTRTYSGISTGTYEITEAPVVGFDTFINCVDASGDTTVSGNKATAKVALGETVTCTFTNEKQIPEISIDDVSIVEGTGGTTTMQFTVVRTNNYFATSVTANSADNVSPTKADSPADYGPIINEVVNFAPGGSLSKVVSVDIVTDAIVEADETFFLNLSNPVNGTLVDAQGEGTIENDDKATLKLSGGTSRTETDSGQVEYTFYAVLYDAVQGGFTLDVASLDLTATVADGDYVANSDTLTFVGDVDERHPFKILVNGDTKVEPDETFAAQITNGPVTPLAADIMVTTEVGRFDLDFHTAKIFNDDSAKVTLTGAEVVTEGDSGNTFVKYTATLDNPVVGGFKIPFSTLSGSASNTSDFVDNDQVLTFNGTAGEEKSVTVRVLGDELVEADETFYVSLGDFMNTSLGGDLSVAGSPKIVTIENDDVAMVTLSGDAAVLEGDSGTTAYTFEATLDADVDGGFDIAYSIDDGTATTADGDYQDTAGTLRFSGNKGETQTITVLVNGDVVGEAHETFKVVLRGVTPDKSGITIDKAGSPFEATITNDDTAVFFIDVANIKVSEGAGSIPFEVTLSNRVATTTTVEYHTSDGSAVDGVDYTGVSGTLTFAPGEGVKIVEIPITDDNIDELDETLIVTLSNSTGAGFGNPSVAELLIIDDDQTPEINIDGSPLKVSESVSSLTVVVSLSGPSSSTVEVDINSADGSATAGSDYTAVAQTLTFAPGETSKTITLPILSDAIYEGDETLTLSLSNPDNANLGVEATEVVTILEDSAVPGMSIASVSMLEPESGEAQMTFEVVLSKAAAVDIAVDFTTVDGTAVAGEDYVASSGTLVIKAGTTKGTISVTVLADSDQEGDETFSLILSNPTGAELDPTAATGVTGVIKTGGSVIFLPLISNR